MNFLTIFTPTYNRAHLLHNLYKSLCQQTNKDFTWLIVDDGSCDNTKSLVTQWQQKNEIDIKYVVQHNGGKHVAHNYGVKLCDTELFFCVDSDDRLTKDAVETIKKYWEETSKSGKVGQIMGFCTRRRNLIKELDYKCRDNWPKSNQLIFLQELYPKYHYDGETGLIWITKELKKYAFPVVKNERFVTEIVLYYQFKKKVLVKPDRFYEFAYQPDGYTMEGLKLMVNNPIGTACMLRVFYLTAPSFINKLKADLKYYGWLHYFHISTDTIEKLLNKCEYDDNKKEVIFDVVSALCSAPMSLFYRRKINLRND